MPFKPLFTDETVLRMRRRFKASFPKLDIKTMAIQVGIKPPAMRRILIGETYVRVPEAIPRQLLLQKPVYNRSLTMAQVVSARQRFDCEEVTVKGLAIELGLNIVSVERMLEGTTYKDVPFPSRRATERLIARLTRKGLPPPVRPGALRKRRLRPRAPFAATA